MAITADVVFVGHNSVRYLLTQDGQAGTTLTIPVIGPASGDAADLQTVSLAGPLKKIANVVTDGYGAFAAGVQTQAKARALLLSDTSGANPASGDPSGAISLVPLALCRLLVRSGSEAWQVDADVDGSGFMELNVTGPSTASTCYLDVEVPNTIGA